MRAGDSLGTVNVIGVPQDVLAPADGIVGSTLVESGTAVEYGQELIRIELEGDAPNAIDPPPGCPFHPRCPRMLKGTCDKEMPMFTEQTPGTGHKVACWNPHVDGVQG